MEYHPLGIVDSVVLYGPSQAENTVFSGKHYILPVSWLSSQDRQESLGFHLRWSSYCRYLSPLSFIIQESHSPLAGPALGEVGEAMRELSEVKDSLDMEVKQNFIDPLQNLHDKDLREIQVSATDLWEVTDLNLQT